VAPDREGDFHPPLSRFCTVAAIASDRRLEVEFRLDGSRIVGQPVGLNCACCKPRPLQAAPNPFFEALLVQDLDDQI
jgi:hypothetical protein